MSLHFLSYAEAFAALQSRYPDLTEAELRMWVNGKRGLVALTNHPGKTRRTRLRYPGFRFHWSGSGDQSINVLMDCWFPSKQVFRFVPDRRFLTYKRLVERWQGRTAKDIHAFIAERVNEFRKNPDFGFLDFGAFDPLGRQDLPIEDYVFALDQVEDKERKWFFGPTELPIPQYRPFQMEDARYFACLPLWTRQRAAYLVQGYVRIDNTGHYFYDDLPVVWISSHVPADTVRPLENHYMDIFSMLSFPIEPLAFVDFCEKRDIPLPPALVNSVKEIAGVVALSKPTIVVPMDASPTSPVTRCENEKLANKSAHAVYSMLAAALVQQKQYGRDGLRDREKFLEKWQLDLEKQGIELPIKDRRTLLKYIEKAALKVESLYPE